VPFAQGGGAGRALGEDDWVDASTGAVQLGDVWVRVTSATVEQVGIQSQGQRSLSSEKYLVIRLQLANNGARRRVDYQTWAHQRSSPSKHRVRLLDPTGKTVPQATFPEGEPVGQLLTGGNMYPGKSLDDFLIFTLQFQVPRSMIKVR
jgi:hypothetical protein